MKRARINRALLLFQTVGQRTEATARAKIGTVLAFSPAILIRLSPTI